MIKFFTKIGEFKKAVKDIGIDTSIDPILNLDFPFFESRDKFTVISVPDYSSADSENIIAMTENHTLVYSRKDLQSHERDFKQIMKKKFGESTLMTFLLLKNVIRNYSKEFEKIRAIMNGLDMNPRLDNIEKSGRDLRRLTDRMEELVQLVMALKDRDLEEFDTRLMGIDYEILQGEARYLLERCRSHIYRVASLRTKSEMESNRELNDTMSKLTVIMTFLTIVSIVVAVPGTIGAIFGIPALSDAYFYGHTKFLVSSLVVTTLFSIFLGYFYWRSLKLRRK